MGSRIGRWIAIAAVALFGIAVTGCAILEVKERELVYRPVRDYARSPSDVGLAFEELWIDVGSADGERRERVHAWWIPPARAQAPSILYLHGIRWSLGNNLFRIARLHALGFGVLAIDYRGFGRSDGELPSESQIYVDARAGWDELARRHPHDESRFIYGHSLGAAVALDLAATVDNGAGVIAEAGFTSLGDVIAENYSWVSLLVTQKFDALTRAKSLKMPALFVHGTADRLVPFAMSEKLFAATAGPKRLHLIEGGSHSNRMGTGLDDYRKVVHEFVDSAGELARGRQRALSAAPDQPASQSESAFTRGLSCRFHQESPGFATGSCEESADRNQGSASGRSIYDAGALSGSARRNFSR